jgi:NADPH:quinone reductase-like Zn-dependent oxidoreductase
MKAYVVTQVGEDVELWQQRELRDPEVGPGEVVIKVKATSLNYRDLMIAKSRYGAPTVAELVPLSDGAGEVVAVGAGVTKWAGGDRVAGSFFTHWKSGQFRAEYPNAALRGSASGMLAEYVTLPADGVVRIPSHLSFEEAATLPCAGLTAWNALMETGPKLAPGSTILTLGTGGVSIFALQFAKAAGFDVLSTTSSEVKAERLRALGALGAHEVINYRTHPEWEKEIAKLTGGLGVDHVIEVGGAGTLAKSMMAVRYGGTISLIGVLTGADGRVNPLPVLGKSIRLQGIYVGSTAMFDSMNAAVESLKIHPVIEKVYEFNDAPAALKDLEAAQHVGKLVVRVN